MLHFYGLNLQDSKCYKSFKQDTRAVMFKRSILAVLLTLLTFTVMVSSLKLAGDALRKHQKSPDHLGVRPQWTTLVIPGVEPRRENNGQTKKV